MIASKVYLAQVFANRPINSLLRMNELGRASSTTE